MRRRKKKRELVINIWQPNKLNVIHAYNVPFLPIEKTQAYAVSIDLRHEKLYPATNDWVAPWYF